MSFLFLRLLIRHGIGYIILRPLQRLLRPLPPHPRLHLLLSLNVEGEPETEGALIAPHECTESSSTAPPAPTVFAPFLNVERETDTEAPLIAPHDCAESSSQERSLLYFMLAIGGILIWGIGVIVGLGRIIHGWIGLSLMSRHAQEIPPHKIQAWVPHITARVKASADIPTPMTWGAIRPVILLPNHLLKLEEAQLRIILQHEWSHIQRNDYLLHIISLIAGAMYWFNPLVSGLKKQYILEREKACDEYMLQLGISATQYAEQLIAISRKLIGRQTAWAQVALPMAKFSQTKLRVMALLKETCGKSLPSRKGLMQYVGFFACWIPLVAALSPVSPSAEMEEVDAFLQNIETEHLGEFLEIEEPMISPNPQPIVQPTQETSHSTPIPLVRRDPIPLSNATFPKPSPRPLIPLSQSPHQPSGTYTSWDKGNSTFQLWTVGEVTILDHKPYVEFGSPEDMLILEERRNGMGGNKTYTMALTPAPYHGGMVQSYRMGVPNSYSYRSKGSLLVFWWKDKEWVFLGRKKEPWMRKHFPKAGKYSKLAGVETNAAENPEWYTVIQEYQRLKAERFIPTDQLDKSRFKAFMVDSLWKASSLHTLSAESEMNERLESRVITQENKRTALLHPVYQKLLELPYVSPSNIPELSPKPWIKVGRDRATQWTSGYSRSNNDNNPDYHFGTVIPYEGTLGTIKELHFHLGHNEFKQITFGATFFKLEGKEVTGKLNEQPITFTIGHEEGWIRHSLENTPVYIDSDVLVVLELMETKYDRKKGLFFSIADGPYKSMESRTGKKGWGIWEMNFAWYLRVAQ